MESSSEEEFEVSIPSGFNVTGTEQHDEQCVMAMKFPKMDLKKEADVDESSKKRSRRLKEKDEF